MYLKKKTILHKLREMINSLDGPDKYVGILLEKTIPGMVTIIYLLSHSIPYDCLK